MKRTKIKPISQKALDERDTIKEFREAVLARDNWSCRRCGDESNLHVHHLLPRSRGGKHEPDNGATMCFSCHDLVHRHLTPDWMDFVR